MKVNKDGNFVPFSGITVIAPLSIDQQILWKSFHDYIKNTPEISSYFNALPIESYHMTVRHLVNELDITTDLADYIVSKKKQLTELRERLDNQNLDLNVTITDASIINNWGIRLYLTLPTSKEIELRKIADDLELDGWTPEKFYITLAYQYQPIPKQEKAKVQEIIFNTIRSAFSNLNQHSAQLCTPKLYYFKDMSAFYTWDAQNNPFQNSATESYNPFFNTKLPSINADESSNVEDTKFHIG